MMISYSQKLCKRIAEFYIMNTLLFSLRSGVFKIIIPPENIIIYYTCILSNFDESITEY